MADGKHCPNCSKDIGFWPYLVALDAKRIWCPYCLNRLQVAKSKRELLMEWLLIFATAGLAGLLSGGPAFLSELIEDRRRLATDELFAHVLAFLCLWVIFLIAVHVGRAWFRRRYFELAPVPSVPKPWQTKMRRLILLLPHSLRWFSGTLLGVGIVGILLICLPICRQRTLLWRIERAGAVVRNGVPCDLADLIAGRKKWDEGLFDEASVTLSGPQADDAALAQVADSLPGISSRVSLVINETRITPAGLSRLAGVRSVRWLKLTNSQIGDDGMGHIQAMPNLRGLEIKDVPITDKGLTQLAGCAGLSSLSIDGAGVSGSGLASWQPLTRVGNLRIANSPVTNDGLTAIGTLKQLYFLDLSETPIEDDMLVHLRSLDKLMSLKLKKTQLSGIGFQHLDQLANLMMIDLSGSPITDAGLSHMADLRALTFMNLEHSQVTDAGLEHLRELPKLGHLSVKGTRVTDEGIARLKTAIPKLTVAK